MSNKVCRWLKSLIEESLDLQYKIECYLAGVVDGDTKAFSLKERLDRLRTWRKSWETGSASEEFSIPLFRPETNDPNLPFKLSGSVFAKVRHDQSIQLIHMYQIPSTCRNIPRKEWAVSTPVSHHIAMLAIDHSQRLLVVLEEYVCGLSLCRYCSCAAQRLRCETVEYPFIRFCQWRGPLSSSTHGHRQSQL